MRLNAFVTVILMQAAIVGGTRGHAEEASSPPLTLRLERAQQPRTLYPLLPVFLELRIVNNSPETVTIPPIPPGEILPRLNPAFRIYLAEETDRELQRVYLYKDVDLQHVRDYFARYSTEVEGARSASFDLVLGVRPWKDVRVPENEITLFYSRRKYDDPDFALFWRPGEYRIKVTLRAAVSLHGDKRGMPFESNELAIKIEEPTGENLEAYAHLFESDCPAVFSDPATFDFFRKGDAVAREIIKRFPNSEYARYARCYAADLDALRALSSDPEFPMADVAAMEFLGVAGGKRADELTRIIKEHDLGPGKQMRHPDEITTSEMKKAMALEMEGRKRVLELLSPEERKKLRDNDDGIRLVGDRLYRKYWAE